MAGTHTKGLLIAAPQSGAGKTTVTLALLRALKNAGREIVSAKSGPDYIDPKFHEAASGRTCINLDAWAMTPETVRALGSSHAEAADLLIVEGAMGLFDGAATGKGSAADLATCLGVPVVLVVDCSKQAQSVAALVNGFRTYREDMAVAGVILNKVGSARHEKMLRDALVPLPVSVLGALPRMDDLVLPERHLGLVQAEEHADLDTFLEQAAALCAQLIDLDALAGLATPLAPPRAPAAVLPPLGQRIAVARDVAFAFSYSHILDGWRRAGADLSFFSPLADEQPDPAADAIFLPGGYPELHAGPLAAAGTFRKAMREAAARGTLIYGECGGYMALGEGLVDAQGVAHQMLGLLPLETSFADRKRHLGYRVLSPRSALPWPCELAAHEFHYATTLREGAAERLFAAADAVGAAVADMGLRIGSVMGSFAHVIGVR
ncbi:cobyrinate a,c-diamide synthase [Roseibium aggregatum]|uniref:Hydrogenobyrinate a,c-diamide synthase n=1 Tax=Roseibium aggregatum TaxID=187304 RepID=A0A926P3G7_9HYPH|nr:cobyrinate a,c-diamide synthase [Roseibium aggregatum]MBD1548945.1 cobyrinate a,c-diamide synthase [Roseibium aggregatum]